MSEPEEIELFERIVENIRQAQRKLFERKAKLGEDIVIADENGQPLVIKAEDYLKQIDGNDNSK
jgi:hypothetical protein